MGRTRCGTSPWSDSVGLAIADGARLDPLDVASAFDEVRSRLFAARPEPIRVDRYRLLERLGQGGCGVVYRAHDPTLRREVAVKLIPLAVGPHGDADRARHRLLTEARTLGSLSHPHVVSIYDVGGYAWPAVHASARRGIGTSGVYLVMELLDGPTLADWLDDGARSRGEIVARFIETARGLAAAHDAGIVHGDFKPSNVMLDAEGRLKVLDFGLARFCGDAAPSDTMRGERSEADAHRTASGTVMGTPAFMSPEQHRGEALGPESDQYSLSIGLFRAVLGSLPFSGRSMTELHGRKHAERIAWPAEARELPAALRRVLTRGLKADPRRRFASMEAFAEALERAHRDVRWRRIARMGLVAGAAVVAAGLGGAEWSERRTQQACTQEAGALGELWNETRADEIGRAFHATGIAYAADAWARTRRRVDDHVRAWIDVRESLCRADGLVGGPEGPMAAAARACLDERRAELTGLLEQLQRPEAIVVRKAAKASAALLSPRDCIDERVLAGHAATLPTEMERARARAATTALWRAKAMASTGRHLAALEHARAVVTEATELRWPPLVVRARLTVAEAARGLARFDEATEEIERGYLDAVAADRDDLAMRAATAMARLFVGDLQRTDEALRWAGLAEVHAQRADEGETHARARLLDALGHIHQARGEYVQALAVRRRALAIIQRELGPEHPDVSIALDGLGVVHEALGEHALALMHLQAALTISHEALGRDHPRTARILVDMGRLHESMGEPEVALAVYRDALAILERALGPRHLRVARVLDEIGNALDTMAEDEEALAARRRALEIRSRRSTREDPDTMPPGAGSQPRSAWYVRSPSSPK